MRTVYVIAVLFFAVFCQVGLHAHSLSGVITEDHTGAMVVSAEIQISRSGVAELIADIETDSNGRFAIENLPDGHYRIQISKANYMGLDLPMDLLPDSPQQPPLALRLIRCGSVEGRVLDAEGQPVTDATVSVLQSNKSTGGLIPFEPRRSGHKSRVDEQGRYRLYNLPPGEFLVAATFGASTRNVGSLGDATVGKTGSGFVFYPSNGQPRQFRIAGGEEFRDTDFTVAPASLYRVSGRVTSPVTGPGQVWVALSSTEQPLFATAVAIAEQDGTFHMDGVPAGSYVLLASGPSTSRGSLGALPPPNSSFARVPVSVESDVADVPIPMERGRSASFSLKTDASGASCPAALAIRLSPLEDWAAEIERDATVTSGKVEVVTGLAPTRYSISMKDPDSECLVAPGGVLDLTSSKSAQVIALQVVREGSIAGVVRGNGAGWVALISTGSTPARVARVDEQRRFSFLKVRPGRYQVCLQSPRQCQATSVGPGTNRIELAVGGPAK